MMAATYATRDPYLAAYLDLQGFSHATHQDEAGAVWFVFPAEARVYKGRFHRGAQVEARAYGQILGGVWAEVWWYTCEQEATPC